MQAWVNTYLTLDIPTNKSLLKDRYSFMEFFTRSFTVFQPKTGKFIMIFDMGFPRFLNVFLVIFRDQKFLKIMEMKA